VDIMSSHFQSIEASYKKPYVLLNKKSTVCGTKESKRLMGILGFQLFAVLFF